MQVQIPSKAHGRVNHSYHASDPVRRASLNSIREDQRISSRTSSNKNMIISLTLLSGSTPHSQEKLAHCSQESPGDHAVETLVELTSWSAAETAASIVVDFLQQAAVSGVHHQGLTGVPDLN